MNVWNDVSLNNAKNVCFLVKRKTNTKQKTKHKTKIPNNNKNIC